MKTAHYHHCPGCYEHWKCHFDCTIEPDLEDQGRQFGAHCLCDDCEREARCRSDNDEKYKTQEFWNWYNGFTKRRFR